jgi:hypothetical protein
MTTDAEQLADLRARIEKLEASSETTRTALQDFARMLIQKFSAELSKATGCPFTLDDFDEAKPGKH